MTQRFRARYGAFALGFAVCLTGSACQSLDPAPKPSTSCGVEADQLDSFMPPVNLSNGPVTVSIDSRFWEAKRGRGNGNGNGNDDERARASGNDGFMMSSILAAIGTWNDFGRRTLGRDLFQTSEDSMNIASETPAADNECGFSGSNDSSFRIVREDSIEHWRALGLMGGGGGSVVPGVTARCTGGGRLSKQVILLNTRFTDSRQFMSVVLHELGHALGLDHSCGNGAEVGPGFRSCSGLSPNHPYFVAVMYPVFRISAPGTSGTDIKQSLRTNDMLRAQCLYNAR